MSPKFCNEGFTLIELMIVVIVLGSILSVGTPLLRGAVQKNELRAQSLRFLGAINLARSEAVMRNTPVSICPSSMAISGRPECTGNYADGWIVFANADRDRVVDADTDQVLRVFEGLPPGFRLTNRNGTRDAFELINYLPDGTSHSNRTLLFCSPDGAARHNVSIVLNIVGRARLVGDWGECPAT